MTQYSKVNWVDGTSGGTPIDAANLGKMDQGIADEDVRNPSSAASAALAGEYTPIGAAALGPRFLFLGDSITAGSVTSDQSSWVGGFTVQAALQSKGQILQTRNAGVPGNTAAQMLSRFSTDVTSYASQIDTVFLLAGTNDSPNIGSGSTTFASWVSTMKSLIANIRAIGKAPVMATIPPNNAAAPRQQVVTRQNAWIRRYATQQHIPLVDFYKVLVDPATGLYLSGYSSDGTHPVPAAQVVMATAMVNALSSLLPPVSIVIPEDNNDPNNLLSNGCFANWTAAATPPTVTAAATGTGGALAAGTYFYKVTGVTYQGESLPSAEVSATITAGQNVQLTIPSGGWNTINVYRSTASGGEVLLASGVTAAANPASTVWTDTGALTPGTTPPPTQDYTTYPTGWQTINGLPAQLSKLTDPAFAGFAARLASNGNPCGQAQTVSSGFSVGDTIAIIAVIRGGGGNVPAVKVVFNGATGTPNNVNVSGAGTAAWGPGVYYTEWVIPAGTTSITYNWTNQSSGTGPVDFGQVGIYNLTALGVL